MTVVVVDYGMGNLRSVERALRHVAADLPGEEVVISDRATDIDRAERVVFPGQGAMASGLRELGERGLLESVVRAAREKPFLGICLGLQVLFDHSQEHGGTPGLGLVAGDVIPFKAPRGERLKIPHMGWNRVRITAPHPLWQGLPAEPWFYFVHSYHGLPEERQLVAGTTGYGAGEFVSALARGNLFAVQFHPEKSHHVGLRMLSNFLSWDGLS